MRPLSRLYLVGAVLAAALGLFVLGHQLISPVPPVTTGCLDVTFDTLASPADRSRRWVVMDACPHFDRTELDLGLTVSDSAGEVHGGGIFTGSLPGPPGDWPRHLRLRWQGPDTLLVEHDAGMRFLSRWDTAGGVGIIYRTLERPR